MPIASTGDWQNSGRRIAAIWLHGHQLTYLTFFSFSVALLLGGGARQGRWSDALVELASLPLLGVALFRALTRPLPPQTKWPLILASGVALLPLFQLIPLPPPLWAALAGREPFRLAYEEAGMALPWQRISLDPGATWLSFLSLLPGFSVFLATLLSELKTRRVLSIVLLGFAFGSVLLGLAQLTGAPWQMYGSDSADEAVGFFANRNHYAALLTSAIPLSAAWSAGLSQTQDRRPGLGLALLFLAYAILLLGLGIAHSRAGLILAFVAALASSSLAWTSSRGQAETASRMKLWLFFIGANLCGLLLAFQFGFVSFANRMEKENLLSDLRWPIAQITAEATAANLPFGIGLGAFEPVYQMHEPIAAAIPAYVNYAHNDWLELVLDGGLPAAALILAFLAWYLRCSFAVWSKPLNRNEAIDGVLKQAGSIVVLLLMLHSTVDYPLHTQALMVVFAFAAALMLPSLTQGLSPEGKQRVRRRYKMNSGQIASSAKDQPMQHA